jgi:hypothetical protein
MNERTKLYYEKHPDKHIEKQKKNDIRRRKNGILSMSENRECAAYLGIHVAERVLSKVFKNVERQPNNTTGFDFICNRGKKIDVKSACLCYGKRGNPRWTFQTNYNKIADYFIFLAFDNRKNLTPMYVWLIPADILNTKSGAGITIKTLDKWNQYSIPIDKVAACCDVLR